MRRSFVFVFAAAVFALALTLSSPLTTRTVSSADLQEKCNDCLARTQRQFDHCLAIHGSEITFCFDKFNDDIVNCHRNFCEQ